MAVGVGVGLRVAVGVAVGVVLRVVLRVAVGVAVGVVMRAAVGVAVGVRVGVERRDMRLLVMPRCHTPCTTTHPLIPLPHSSLTPATVAPRARAAPETPATPPPTWHSAPGLSSAPSRTAGSSGTAKVERHGYSLQVRCIATMAHGTFACARADHSVALSPETARGSRRSARPRASRSPPAPPSR